ncbi:T9SS type B sorting domain-containing protein [Pedobacter frigidisoli]|uniref:T9SS type B sorting domain-containing protein n=1 Tax=Pedobacter frigidisoli TaxID=2530455 RepID=A0A4V6N676_9SPHI|nr:PKD domain-containing protein [Pedobacter frigidisoli]TCD10212.1 T9SS type B sorting domain-containing protein [Pedobacter frigidisoli]
MRFSLALIFFILTNLAVFAKFAAPVNDDLLNAITITNTTAFCSEDAAYSNIDATASSYNKPMNWSNVGKDVWFKFTATKTDVNIYATGQVNGNNTNTMLIPLLALYTFDPLTNFITEIPAATSISINVNAMYKGGLKLGQVYYIRISAFNDNTGTFKLCVDNYFPPLQPGQDCGTFSILCSKETFTQLNVAGGGNNLTETIGTCLDGNEANTAWYMFKASKAGSFTFTITPTVTTNDIDWVFYDLGLNGDCSNMNAAAAIRCAAGSGVTCTPTYYKTGLSLTETDLTEAGGCNQGQNGFVKYADLVEDHVYALLVNNYDEANNGFTLEFDGTADFAGPTAEIEVQKLNPCTDNQAYTFTSNATNYASLKWEFGDGASLSTATGEGPFTITYSTPGLKVIVLEAKSTNGCNVINTETIIVAKTPDKPIITPSDVTLCEGDILKLSTPFLDLATYHWTGPNGFLSENQNPEIPITGVENVGIYSLYIQVGDCVSEVNSVEILSVDLKPEAIFSIEVNNKCEANQSFSIVNASTKYTKLMWDFGPGVKSEITTLNDSRVLTFDTPGLKTLTLTVETPNGCTSTISHDILVELKPEKPEIAVNQALFCLKDIIKLSVPELDGIVYAWTGPNKFNASTSSVEIPITDFNQAGEYVVTLTSGTCTSDPASITIPEIARIPIANFYTEPSFNVKFSVPAPITFINTSKFADFYLWEFGDGFTSTDLSPTHRYQIDGIFKIKLTAFSKNGCSTSIIQGDLLVKKEASIFVPNAFSPNGDGVNDNLVVGITNLKKYRIQIYNRYGNQIFFTDNIFDNWKGDFKGNQLPVGVYYYVISGTNLSENSVRYSGSITLIR